MRIVVAIDGELLVPQDGGLGIPGQKQAVAQVVDNLSALLCEQHELVIIHGNAPQVGYVLLRSEVASHIVHPLPLDVCGSDTQGATGYLLQQAIKNWLLRQKIDREVVSLVTQVLVDDGDPGFDPPTRGVGPYYDPDKAKLYASSRDWNFVLVPGRGFRRSVPSLKPVQVIEARSIENLLVGGAIVICAGGGGIPVKYDQFGLLRGVEAVVDKSATTQLLAQEIRAEGMIFITLSSCLDMLLPTSGCGPHYQISADNLDDFIKHHPEIELELGNKLQACRNFIMKRVNGWSLISSLYQLDLDIAASGGLWITADGNPAQVA